MEMVDSVDDLKSSRSIRGTHGPDFEVLDAKIASALNRIIQNTRFKKTKSTQPNCSPRSSTRQNEKNASRARSHRGKSPSGRMSRLPCKDYLKGTCTTPFCENWHPPECLFYKTENGCKFGEKCSYALRQVDEQPSKRSKKNGDKSAVAMLKITRQLGCVFQDMEPPKSSSICGRAQTY